MKIKYIALTLAAILSFGTFAVGCSSSENSEQQILDSREVDFSEIGLKYTTPESWQEYTKKNNIYPFTYTEDFTIENIRYNYITPTDWKTISNAKDGFVIDDYLYPICEIVVVQTENASKLKTSGLYRIFQKDFSVFFNFCDIGVMIYNRNFCVMVPLCRTRPDIKICNIFFKRTY